MIPNVQVIKKRSFPEWIKNAHMDIMPEYWNKHHLAPVSKLKTAVQNGSKTEIPKQLVGRKIEQFEMLVDTHDKLHTQWHRATDNLLPHEFTFNLLHLRQIFPRHKTYQMYFLVRYYLKKARRGKEKSILNLCIVIQKESWNALFQDRNDESILKFFKNLIRLFGRHATADRMIRETLHYWSAGGYYKKNGCVSNGHAYVKMTEAWINDVNHIRYVIQEPFPRYDFDL